MCVLYNLVLIVKVGWSNAPTFVSNIIRPKLLKKKVCPLQSPISFRLGLLLLKRREMVIFLLFFLVYLYIQV